MLHWLAIIAAAHKRDLAEELNIAVESHVQSEFAEHGEKKLIERAFAEQKRTAMRHPSLF